MQVDRAEPPVVDGEDVAAHGGRRPRERAAEDDVAGFEPLAVRRDLVGEPGDAVAGMVEHAGGKARLLDDAVLRQDRADPAQVDLAGPHRRAAGDDAGVGGEVGDGVEHLARCLRLAVELLDARVDDLDRRRDDVGRREHVGERHAGAAQRPREDEGELDLDARRDEALDRDRAASGEEHVVEERREVGLVDLRRELHRARGEADLAALDDAPFGQPPLEPRTLDRVAVVDRHARMAQREVAHLQAPLLGIVQLGGERGDRGGVEHARISGPGRADAACCAWRRTPARLRRSAA
jgi:hypothetical protein